MTIASALTFTVGIAAAAHADPVDLRFVSTVPRGQRPKIQLVINQSVQGVTVDLSRENGTLLSARFGALAAGTTQEVLLDGEPGPHRYRGKIAITEDGSIREVPVELDTWVTTELELAVDRSKVDLAARRLEVRLSRPAAKVEVKALNPHGVVVAEATATFAAAAPGAPLAVSWPAPPAGADVARLDVKAFDTAGFWRSVALFPWSLRIPHEEVNFATGSAAIAASETPKLEASLRAVAQALRDHGSIGPVRLFVAGHTDSVAEAAYNLRLSRERAAAIGAWFRRRGLKLPIYVEGFGEFAPLVATPDGTDEPRNRRADYILSVEEPAIAGTTAAGHRAAWRAIR